MNTLFIQFGKKLIRIIFENFIDIFYIHHKYLMENLAPHSNYIPRQISCSCSLINLQYNIQKAPSKNRSFFTCSANNQNNKQNGRSYKTTATTTYHTNDNDRRKSKISLARSMSRTFSNQDDGLIGESGMSYKYQPNDSSAGFQTINIYNSSKTHNLKASIDSNASEDYMFKKRQNSFNFYGKNKLFHHRWTTDLELTKNTTFDNSQQNSELKLVQNNYNQKKMSENYEFSFYNQKKSDQKTSNRRQRDRLLQKPVYEQNQQSIVHITSQAGSIPGIGESSVRRIKTLRQLEYKHAESSGGGTSQNHMSMIVSIDEEKQEELKGLDGLIRRGTMAKTWHQMR